MNKLNRTRVGSCVSFSENFINEGGFNIDTRREGNFENAERNNTALKVEKAREGFNYWLLYSWIHLHFAESLIIL